MGIVVGPMSSSVSWTRSPNRIRASAVSIGSACAARVSRPGAVTGLERGERSMSRWVRFVPVVGVVAGYAALHRAGRCYGSTAAERAAALPGDELVVDPQIVCTHAVTIAAGADRIWPWLVQMGWHRGGWYTARWLDQLLFPDHWASADELLPDYQHLAVGDFIPDGAPETGCGFTVVDLQPERYLLLQSTTHLPRSWRNRGIAALDWTWVFVLYSVDGGARTRFVFGGAEGHTPGGCGCYATPSSCLLTSSCPGTCCAAFDNAPNGRMSACWQLPALSACRRPGDQPG